MGEEWKDSPRNYDCEKRNGVIIGGIWGRKGLILQICNTITLANECLRIEENSPLTLKGRSNLKQSATTRHCSFSVRVLNF